MAQPEHYSDFNCYVQGEAFFYTAAGLELHPFPQTRHLLLALLCQSCLTLISISHSTLCAPFSFISVSFLPSLSSAAICQSSFACVDDLFLDFQSFSLLFYFIFISDSLVFFVPFLRLFFCMVLFRLFIMLIPFLVQYSAFLYRRVFCSCFCLLSYCVSLFSRISTILYFTCICRLVNVCSRTHTLSLFIIFSFSSLQIFFVNTVY